MITDEATTKISDDGKILICISKDQNVRWKRKGPSIYEWQRLSKKHASVDVENGRFQYAGNESHGKIVAVFTPWCGLDFNLTYLADSGELLSIDEAR